MLLAYIDESGNTGDIDKGGSLTYTLGCVLIDSEDWPDSFNEMLAFRRRIRDTFGVPMRVELKASYLLRNAGPLRDLGLAPAQRSLIYRAHMRELHQLKAKAFGIVIDKRKGTAPPDDVFELAWTTLLQRLERASYYGNTPFMIFHDEGEDAQIRKLVRKARRYLTAGSMYGGGSLVNAAKRLIDDPVARRSDHSYLVQMADLVAYAAFRSTIAPGGSIAAVCPQNMWEQIGEAIRTETNRVKGGTPGIVVREA
ncbi:MULTISPECIES: DUF3800 domain-containing protein [unclassified Micromonospora]|uniref:DUF3800 domain-containing protein n=1 Tax=unclassified Micromonospora TaxID=2617518 RepID=UPI000EF4A19A|nr:MULTISPECIES: DUF3800 domain-containing protein [unclassified Micromonospora]RLP90582.1 DUF3800 domain-containing protein [Micromonospora sp. BL4]RLP95866.1 DUF3800 domain-containing protein [Micromonospora sp. CV4]